MLFFSVDKSVLGMVALRILSGMIELAAAMLMLKLNRVESALKVNAMLALIGPLIMLGVMGIGIIGLAGKIHFSKLIYILVGVGLIFWGLNK
jgi:hypothetical protein